MWINGRHTPVRDRRTLGNPDLVAKQVQQALKDVWSSAPTAVRRIEPSVASWSQAASSCGRSRCACSAWGRCADALVELVLRMGMPLEGGHAVDVGLNGEGNDSEAIGGAQSWDVPVRGEKQTGVSVSG